MVETALVDEVDQISRWIDEELGRCRATAPSGATTDEVLGDDPALEAFLAHARNFLAKQPDPGAILAELAQAIAHGVPVHSPVVDNDADANPPDAAPDKAANDRISGAQP